MIYIGLGVLALFCIIGIGVGIYLWIKGSSSSGGCNPTYPPTGGNIKNDNRLMGTPAGGGSDGQDSDTVEDCYKFCNCNADPATSGFAFWKNNKKCWCTKSPYFQQQWVPDPEWTSGTFIKTT